MKTIFISLIILALAINSIQSFQVSSSRKLKRKSDPVPVPAVSVLKCNDGEYNITDSASQIHKDAQAATQATEKSKDTKSQKRQKKSKKQVVVSQNDLDAVKSQHQQCFACPLNATCSSQVLKCDVGFHAVLSAVDNTTKNSNYSCIQAPKSYFRYDDKIVHQETKVNSNPDNCNDTSYSTKATKEHLKAANEKHEKKDENKHVEKVAEHQSPKNRRFQKRSEPVATVAKVVESVATVAKVEHEAPVCFACPENSKDCGIKSNHVLSCIDNYEVTEEKEGPNKGQYICSKKSRRHANKNRRQ